MSEPKKPKRRKAPAAGLLPLVVLKLLSEKPMHGYQIAEEIFQRIGYRMALPPIYMALRRLESRGFVRSEWITGSSGPARRIYHITEEGKALLESRIKRLRIIKKLADIVLE